MRRSLAETKELLLATGLRALHERGLFVAVTHIRLSDVARAADLTTGAAYRVWENQEEFHRDLAVAAVRHRNEETIAATTARITDAVLAGAPLAEVLRIGAEAHLYLNRPDDPFLITLSLRTLSSAVAEVGDASRERHAESMAAFEGLYAQMLEQYRRRMRPPLEIDALSHALAAVTEGFAIQAMSGLEHRRYELEDVPDGVGRDWTLVGLAVEGIVERLTEPID